MSSIIYSDPRITREAKGLLDDPPKVKEYIDATKETVDEVVSAILERVDEIVRQRTLRERS